MIYGVGTHVIRSNVGRAKVALGDLRVESTRDEITWASCEMVAGHFVLTDHHLAKLEAWDSVGTDNVFILCYGNTLYSIGQPYTQAEREKFLEYVRFIVPIIAPRCRYIEIWNEWDIGSGRSAAQRASGQHSGAEEYAALCREVSPIIRELAPNSVILGGVIGWLRAVWIEPAIDAGLLNAVDAISVHAYNYNVTPPSPENAIARVDAYQDVLKAKNANQEVDIYITEMGWPTHTRGAGPDVGQAASTVSTWLSRFYRFCEKRPWAKGVWWYDLWDDGADQSNKEHRFGLVANDARTPKPAYYAFKGLTHRGRRNKEFGWCRVAVTTAAAAAINAKTLGALKDLRSTNTDVVIGGRTLRVMSGPIELTGLDQIVDRFADDFIITEGPVVLGVTPAQTTATLDSTWPNGWKQ